MFGSPTTATGQKPVAALSNHSLLARMDKSRLKKIVAERLLEARELNGYSQTEAALKFGYKTPAQLSLWEMNRRFPPPAMLVRASAVYRVSLDYLMGISPEPDRDPMSAQRLHVTAAAQQMCAGMSNTLAEAIIEQTRMGGPTVEAAYAIVGESERLVNAFKKFTELNEKKFELMRGGNTLKTSFESFEANGLALAKEQIARHARTNAAAVKSLMKKIAPQDHKSRALFEPTDA
jgi:transcriptional regulator with XRE-family HTH domain